MVTKYKWKNYIYGIYMHWYFVVLRILNILLGHAINNIWNFRDICDVSAIPYKNGQWVRYSTIYIYFCGPEHHQL